MAKKSTQADREEGRTLKEPKIQASNIPYVRNTWAGREHWQCLLCSFDTFDEDALFIHIVAHNLGGQKPAAPQAEAEGESNPPEGEQADGIFEIELEEADNG